MLLDSFSSHAEERRKVHKSTELLFFLGTPHRASNRAAWGDMATDLAVTSFTTDPLLLQQLNAHPLMRLQVEFGDLVYQRTFLTKTFTEARTSNSFLWWNAKVCLTMLKTSRRGDSLKVWQIVDEYVAILGDPGREVEFNVDADHTNRVRFWGKNDPNYKIVAGELSMSVLQIIA